MLGGVGFGGVLLWSAVSWPEAPRWDPAVYTADAGPARQVARPNVDLGKGLVAPEGSAVCRPSARAGSARAEAPTVCVRLPADWAVVEGERHGALARYFVGVFWASAETGSGVGWPQTRP